MSRLVDTHCHLTDKAFDEDRDGTLERALAAGVSHIVAVGGGGPIEDSEKAAQLARSHGHIRSTAGIHPHDASSYDDDTEARIRALLELPEVVAVGETGLDYHYDHSSREQQRQALARQLALAGETGLPVVLHCRQAEADLREVIAAEANNSLGGVVHCFTGNYDDAVWYLDHGLLISLTGIMTFKKAEELRSVIRRLPLEGLMVETDSPYLAPEPYRGKRNEPAYVKDVAEALAGLLELDLDEVVDKTGANAAALFSL